MIEGARLVGLDHGLARGLVVIRWVTLAWAVIGVAVQRDDLRRPVLAVLALLAASGFSVATTVLVATRRRIAVSVPMVLAELALGCGLLVLDGAVFDAAREQSLPWAWPAAGVMAAAVVGGVRFGATAALACALASFAGESLLRDRAYWTVAAASKSALFALAAIATAMVVARLREADSEIADVRAREAVARTLHDGVLQTLAVIQRRDLDPELQAMARDQERELRVFLRGGATPTDDLPGALRRAGARVARDHGIEADVVLAADLPKLRDAAAEALVAAATEALVNAAKHSGAARVTLFAEPGDDAAVFCTVRDNGVGFDASAPTDGFGLRSSIGERMRSVGGGVEVVSRPGRGTEVRLWVS